MVVSSVSLTLIQWMARIYLCVSLYRGLFDFSFTDFFLDPRIFFFLTNRKRRAKTSMIYVKSSLCVEAIDSDI